MTAIFCNRDRKHLAEKIHSLTATEHEEVFKLLHAKGIRYMQNNNGIFFNLSNVPDAVLVQVNSFVDFCLENKAHLDDYDKRFNECKMRQVSLPTDVAKPADLASSALHKPAVSSDLCSVLKQTAEIEAVQQAFAAAAAEDPRLHVLLDRLQQQAERIHKKKNASKFATAKKKFAKRIAPGSASVLPADGSDGSGGVLVEDAPLIT